MDGPDRLGGTKVTGSRSVTELKTADHPELGGRPVSGLTEMQTPLVPGRVPLTT